MDEGDDDHHSSYTKTLQLFVSGFDGVCLCLFRFQSDGNCVSSREGVRFEGFRRRFGQRKPICGECDASKRKQAKIFRVLFLHSSPHSQTCLGSGRQPVFCGREADEAALSLINAAASPLFPHPRLPARQRRG